MSNQQNDEVVRETDEELIDYTLDIRKRLVGHMTEQGKKFPEESKYQQTLLSNLDGIERIALTRMKIKSEDQANASNTAAANLIAEVLRGGAAKEHYTLKDLNGVPPRQTPVLGFDIPAPVLVPGEIDIAAPRTSYDSFKDNDADEDEVA